MMVSDCMQIMLGVDRLDMIKGIPQKLLAFEKFLEEHPDWRDKVLLVQIAVPTRGDVPEYQVPPTSSLKPKHHAHNGLAASIVITFPKALFKAGECLHLTSQNTLGKGLGLCKFTRLPSFCVSLPEKSLEASRKVLSHVSIPAHCSNYDGLCTRSWAASTATTAH